jgi:hypothetical protein
MKAFYTLLVPLLLTACQASRTPAKSPYDREQASAKDSAAPAAPFKRDSPFKTLFAKRKPEAQPVSTLPTIPTRKCKGCTFNVAAPGSSINNVGKKATAATAAGATAIGKAKGQQAIGDSSVLNAVTGGGALANVVGDGNTLEQKPTTKEAPDWKAALTGPIGYVLAAGVVALGLWGFLAYRRSRSAVKIVQEPTKIIG